MKTLTTTQHRWIQVAFNEAEKSVYNSRHGCVIVKSGRIVGKGHNHLRARDRQNVINGCASCHAEASAILNAIAVKKWHVPHAKGPHAKGAHAKVANQGFARQGKYPLCC